MFERPLTRHSILAKNAQRSKTVKDCPGLRQWVIRRFDQGPIPEVWVVITRCERIDVDLRFSPLEIKRADQVDVLPRIGRNIFDDVGGYVVCGGLLLCVHTRRSRTLRGALALNPGVFTLKATKLLPFWSVGHF